ncbi:MAG: Gfo/Idh/MocA family oxidoreductase [Candidatus Kapabacteria bacterium]|nr:Gfo/Idh/MocA family oxidoreductase [Candidatus Kapabacteria bacterium]
MLNIGVVGCGYWGNHILRNFNSSENWNLVIACDKEQSQINKVKSLYLNTRFTLDFNDILNDPNIDAIAISTPVSSHFELAKATLLAGKHAWVEKPLTSTKEESEELIEIASSKNLILNVDHTFIYTSSVQKIKNLIDSNDLGDILYFDSVRINLGLFQHDVNVIWDLAPHDISIIQYCIGKKPIAVNATGAGLVKYGLKNLENIAYVTIHFDDWSIAHLHLNWLSPVKVRKIIIGGTKKMLVFDDMEQSEKLKIYDSGVKVTSRDDIYDALVQYRIGDMYSPSIGNKEALKEEVEHFYQCILNGQHTITDGEAGLYVVKILEAANESIRLNGEKIKII